MPTYSYECKKCAHVREVYHQMSADPSVKCEECGSAMRRLIGAGAGIIFKGTGFYETDYKTKNGGGAKGGGGKASGESKSETKSESKTEAKTETKSSAKSESSSSSSSKST